MGIDDKCKHEVVLNVREWADIGRMLAECVGCETKTGMSSVTFKDGEYIETNQTYQGQHKDYRGKNLWVKPELAKQYNSASEIVYGLSEPINVGGK